MLSTPLDPRTLGVVTAFTGVGMTALALMLWRSKQMYAGFGRWTLARMMAMATIVFSYQIGTWPHSIVYAGCFAIFAAILSLEACRQFLGLRPFLPWIYAGAGLIILQSVVIEGNSSSSQASYVEVTLALSFVQALTGLTLLRKLPRGASQGRLLAGITFLTRGTIYLGRTVYFVAHPKGTLFDSSAVNLAFLASNLVYDIVSNFSFFLMHYERVLSDKAAEVAVAKSSNKALVELKVNLEERVRQRTAELVRSQKLESVARLAGGVAHDFNNVLMVINGYSALLLTQMDPLDPKYDPIAQIGKAGERAAGITRQLLAFSRQQKYDPQTVSLGALIQEMLEMLRRLIGEDVEIVLVPGNGRFDIKADKGQIEQVVMNLSINARDAMPGGGKLFLEIGLTQVTTEFAEEHPTVPPGRYVVLSVTDTGVGMTPEVQARIFEPFYTTKGHEGTGLGLSTTYGIVKQCGGHITVLSTPGFGTTFRMYLPAVEPAAEELDLADAIHGPVRGTETILLVEDQEDVRRFIREILGEHGYHTLEAAGGDEAIKIADRYPAPIHLLITDMVLPQMNGPEIVSLINNIHPGIGVLMMSGYTAERVDGQLSDETPYLQKPFTPEQLLKHVREILDASRLSFPLQVE